MTAPPSILRSTAILSASRRLFSFNALSMTACPTHMDIPRFIRKIASGNLPGPTQTVLEAHILDANMLGAS